MLIWESGERPGNNVLKRLNLVSVICVFGASRRKWGQAEQGVFPAHMITFEGGGLSVHGNCRGLGEKEALLA